MHSGRGAWCSTIMFQWKGKTLLFEHNHVTLMLAKRPLFCGGASSCITVYGKGTGWILDNFPNFAFYYPSFFFNFFRVCLAEFGGEAFIYSCVSEKMLIFLKNRMREKKNLEQGQHQKCSDIYFTTDIFGVLLGESCSQRSRSYNFKLVTLAARHGRMAAARICAQV